MLLLSKLYWDWGETKREEIETGKKGREQKDKREDTGKGVRETGVWRLKEGRITIETDLCELDVMHLQLSRKVSMEGSRPFFCDVKTYNHDTQTLCVSEWQL